MELFANCVRSVPITVKLRSLGCCPARDVGSPGMAGAVLELDV